MIHEDRIRALNDDEPRRGRYVLYWMQQSQRARFNHALEHAVREANDRGLPVLVGFGLMDDYPEANARHYRFMLEGLRDVGGDLRERGIPFVVKRGRPDAVAVGLAEDAALVVCDRGYLRHQRAWRREVARRAGRRVVEVEGDVVVPVDAASDKREWAARTLRPKIQRLTKTYLKGLAESDVSKRRRSLGPEGDVDPSRPERVLKGLKVDGSVAPVARFPGGSSEARRRLTRFLRSKLDGYADGRGEPADEQVSTLSPYLHFGQISPVEAALKVSSAKGGRKKDKDAFLEELVVRRELAVNFVTFEKEYDAYGALPDWARKTLDEHRDDEREHVYTRGELEAGETHDPYWNAAMKEMTATGYMHNHMRMYWGKKILEWTNTPEHGFRTALALNNKYFLDGRDASSFANVGWLFGLHDRAWNERDVFGKVRYMSAGGLERKTDVDRYVKHVEKLARDES